MRWALVLLACAGCGDNLALCEPWEEGSLTSVTLWRPIEDGPLEDFEVVPVLGGDGVQGHVMIQVRLRLVGTALPPGVNAEFEVRACLDNDCAETGELLSSRRQNILLETGAAGGETGNARRAFLFLDEDDRGTLARMDVSVCDGTTVQTDSVKLWLEE